MTGSARGRGFLLAVLALAAVAPALFGPRTARASIVAARAEADRQVVLRGEPIAVTVTVESSGFTPASVATPTVPGLTIEKAGTSQNLVLAAGSVMRTDVTVFRVLAAAPGKYVIPYFLASAGKDRMETRSVAFEVVASLPSAGGAPSSGGRAPRAGSPLFARLVLDRTRVVWNEQIVSRFQVYSRSTLEDMPAWEAPASSGFWGEPLGAPTHDRVVIEGTVFERYERRFAFFPTRTGRLTLGPARAIVRVAHRDAPAYDPFAGMVFTPPIGARFVEIPIEAAPVTVSVDPLPPGAPPGFGGAVGSLSLGVHVDRARTRVGEPVTVTTTIRGEGNLASARDPSLTAIPAFPSYPAGTVTDLDRAGERLRGTRRRETAFIPDHPGSLIVLPVAFSWFDPEEGRYRTLRSDTVVVRVAPAGAGSAETSALAQSATSVPAPPRGTRQGRRGGPLAGLPSIGPVLLGAASFAAYAGFGASALVSRRRARDPRRRRYALASAALRAIEGAASRSGAAGASETAIASLRELAALRFGVDQEGRSRREFLRLLRDASVPEESVRDLERILTALESAAFAPATGPAHDRDARAGGPSAALREAHAMARRWRDECRPVPTPRSGSNRRPGPSPRPEPGPRA